MFYATDEIPTHEEPWRSLFQIGLESLAYSLCGDVVLWLDDDQADESNSNFEATVFARLTRQQKVAMLVSVGRALLERDAPSPEKSAVVDATFWSILDQLQVALDLEVDAEVFHLDKVPDRRLRKTIVAVYRQKDAHLPHSEREKLPRVSSMKAGQWRELITGLQESLLEDFDFDDEELYCDDAPEASDFLKFIMHVRDDYFTVTAPEPTGSQLVTLVEELSAMADADLSLEAARK